MPRNEFVHTDITLDDARFQAAATRSTSQISRLQIFFQRLGSSAAEAAIKTRTATDRLETVGERAAAAAAGLGPLSGGLRRTEGDIKGVSRSAVQFSYILNDAQQFQYGFSQGLRAISNNIGPMLAGVKGLTRALGPLLIAVELVSTAAVILTQKSRDAAKEVKALEAATKSLVDLSPIEIKTRFSFEGAAEMEEAVRMLRAEAEQAEFSAPSFFERQQLRLQRALGKTAETRERARQRLEAFSRATDDQIDRAREEASELREVAGALSASAKGIRAMERAAEVLGRTQAKAFRPDLIKASEKEAAAYARTLARLSKAIPEPQFVDWDAMSDAMRAVKDFNLKDALAGAPDLDFSGLDPDRFDQAFEALARLRRDGIEGLVDPLSLAEGRVRILEDAISDLSASGMGSTSGIDALRDALARAKNEARDVAAALFGAEIGGSLGGQLFDNVLGAGRRLKAAQLEVQMQGNRSAEDALKESLKNREISQQEYEARVRLLSLETARLQQELALVTGDAFTRGFANLKEFASSVLQEVIRDLVVAVAKAAALKAILLAVGGPQQAASAGSFGNLVGSFLGSGLGAVLGALGVGSSGATPRVASAPPQRVAVEVGLRASVLPGGSLALAQAEHRRLQDK